MPPANSSTMQRVRAVVCAGVFGVAMAASACADKGPVRPSVAFNPKLTLQLVTTASQTIGFGPRWLLVVAASAAGKDTVPIAYKWVAYASGTQQITLPVDIASCIAANAKAGKDGCTMIVAAALTLDTASFADTTSGKGDPFKQAFDFTIVGPFDAGPGRTPTIPPIDLSASRFGAIYWEGDEALRLGGTSIPSLTQPSAQNSIASIAGVVNGTGAPTIFSLTSGVQNNTSNSPTPQFPFPQLAIFQNGAWRRVTATAAPPLSAGNSGFNDVTAISASEVYMTAFGGLYKFDGTAISRVSGVNDSLASVASVNAGSAKYVIAGGLNGTVWIGNTTTWQRYTLPNNPRVDGVCITGPNEAFASSSSGGGLFHFDGTSWTSVPAATTAAKLDLQCPAPGQAYVIAYLNAYLRWNGSGWSSLPTTGLTSARPTRMAVASPTEIYAYGDSASVDRAFYRFDGTMWREVQRLRFTQPGGRPWAIPGGGGAYVMSAFGRLERVTSSGATVLSYQPSLRDVVVTSSTSAFAVGWNLFLARWDGIRWNVDAPPPATPTVRILQGVWSDGPKNAWAVGGASTIVRWDGSAWSVVSDAPHPISTTDSYNGVWGVGSDVWVVGDNTILHCRAPTSCSTESSGGTGSLFTVWGTSATNVFAVGDGGRIVRYNGTSWSAMTSPTNRTLARVTGSGPADVWALGDSVLVHFDGTSWTSVPMTGGDLQYAQSHVPTVQERGQNPFYQGIFNLGLWARGPKEVYLGTQFGGIERWDGRSWSEVTKSNSAGARHRIMGIAGAPGGCALYVTDAQSDASTPTLGRGVGPTGCFSVPMTAPTTWP